MNRLPLTLCAGALALAATLAPTTASADFTFCNKTWKQLEVNFVQQTSSCAIGWGGWGWYSISPSSCKTVYYGKLPDRYYYYYYYFADSTDGAWNWTSASARWWMPYAAHSGWCTDKTQSSGGTYYNHRQVDTGSYTDCTINLTTSVPSPCGNGCYPASSDECLCPLP